MTPLARPGTAVALEPGPGAAGRRALPEVASPRPRDLRVVEGGRSRLRQTRLVRAGAAGAFVTLVLGLFGAVTSHVALTQGQFRLERLEARSAAEQARYDRLRLQVAELESPERVVAAAKSRLGMVTPGRVTYLAPSGAPMSPPGSAVTAPDSASGAPPAWQSGWVAVKPHLATR